MHFLYILERWQERFVRENERRAQPFEAGIHRKSLVHVPDHWQHDLSRLGLENISGSDKKALLTTLTELTQSLTTNDYLIFPKNAPKPLFFNDFILSPFRA